MTLKSKLTTFIFCFLFITAWLIAGSFLIFNRLSNDFENLRTTTEEHNFNKTLESCLTNLLNAAKSWALTGDTKFRKLYRQRLDEISKCITKIDASGETKKSYVQMKKDFEVLKTMTKGLVSIDNPVRNPAALAALRKIDRKEEEVLSKISALHMNSLRDLSSAIAHGEEVKWNMALFLSVLFSVSSIAFIFLALYLRKVINVPFREILTATDRISSGDINYRIGSKRKDEFGIISNRFDSMVEELKKINEKNAELYISTRIQLDKLRTMYDITKAITSTLDLEELMRRIARDATKLLNARCCTIRLIEGDELVVKASFGVSRDIESKITLSLGEGLMGRVAKEGRPILVEDLSKMSSEWQTPHLDVKSVLAAPLKVGENVIGTIALLDKMTLHSEIIPFSSEDVTTVDGFASLSAIAIEKAKIFEMELQKEREAIEARMRLDVLFDSVQGGIVNIGRDYKIISVNKFVEHLVGSPAISEMIGKNCTDVFHGKIGICPHCVAKVTFETGEVNTIAQASGMNYAELTSYPIRDESGEVRECVVFIQDITDRVIYHEEMISLYREVTQTKEYLESLIDNSADAIVTTDLNGIVTSWNRGAERIFGFSEIDTIGKFLPVVPESLKEAEFEYIEGVRNGGVLKDIETMRRTRNGSMIEVSLTLSPIKDAMGDIIGVSGISRDISEKKRVEKELIRRNQELSRLFFISTAMRSTLELDRLLRMILTAVTMSDGLGFNRSVLFLMDSKRNVLHGAMGVGPANLEEAGNTWEQMTRERTTLSGMMEEIETVPLRKDSLLDELSHTIEIPVDGDCIIARSIREKRPYNVTDVKSEADADAILVQQLGTEAYAVVPLISKDRVIGVLWVDNLFNKKPIQEEDMKFLSAFSNQVAAAIENARLFEQVSFAEAELENIFSSISDMLFFTDIDYNIKSVNRAVIEKFGSPEAMILEKKCYELFHGMNEPWPECPHHMTLVKKKALAKELDDPHLGGTFLTSTSPLFDKTGNCLGTVHLMRDVTELKQIRERLENAERMAALGEVAAKVAHEIRNPLVSVGGFAQRLEKKLDGGLKEYASIITKEVKRLEAILKDILGFVKEVRLSKEHVNLNEIICSICLLQDSVAEEKKILIEMRLGEIPTLLLDPERVKEALLNIISNSIQAVGEGGEILLTTSVRNGYVLTEIHDNGPGIAEKDMPFIFDPFFTTRATGTGLGLSITRRIIEEHKGRIEVKSKPGEGTTLKVYLPIGKEEQ
jgi:PAS domain S-box-containing protein